MSHTQSSTLQVLPTKTLSVQEYWVFTDQRNGKTAQSETTKSENE